MDDDNYMKNYGLMNIDNRVKLIVMFLNKAHYEKNKSNNAHLTTIENNLKHIKEIINKEFISIFGDNKSTHEIKNFFYGLYEIKEIPQKILQKKSDFINILNTNLFSKPSGNYINKLINDYQKSIDTDSLENVLQAMIYHDKNMNFNFDELKIHENNKEAFKSLEDKIKKLQVLDENFLKIYPEYHILQDCVELYKTIYILKNNKYNKLNHEFIFMKPVSFIDVVDMIIKHFMKHLHPNIKSFTLLKTQLVDKLEKLLENFIISGLDSHHLINIIIEINSQINHFLYTVIETGEKRINNMEQIFSKHYDEIKIFKTYLNYLKEFDEFKEQHLQNIIGLKIFVNEGVDYNRIYSFFHYIVELYNRTELIINEYKTKNNLKDYFKDIIDEIKDIIDEIEQVHKKEEYKNFLNDFFYKFVLVIDNINVELSFYDKNEICKWIIAKFENYIFGYTKSYINILIDKYDKGSASTPLQQSAPPPQEHKTNN